MSKNYLFCENWEFSKNPLGTEYRENLPWAEVDLPHDWLIYQVQDLYETSTGWYRKFYSYKNRGLRTALRFEGIYMDSRVYVNGNMAGEWKYGYSTFEIDITEYLKEGENLIAVRVDHQSPNSRWYSGAGIYRNVWLKEYPDTHILSDGIYVTTDITGKVCVSTEVQLHEDGNDCAADRALRTSLWYGDTLEEEFLQPLTEDGASSKTVNTIFTYDWNTQVSNPKLWSLTETNRYLCRVELLEKGQVTDIEETVFGFRKVEFTCDKGFFLNNEWIKIHGACEHHDLGALGAAVNPHAIRRKLTTLREMGVNAIRTSHNMPAVELMDLADEMGFLVMSEAFDMWELSKTEYDYARFFPDWVAKDVASWVRRDRNHPCLIGWSIGNEIYDTHASARGQEITRMLYDLVRIHDPRANGYVTIGSNYMEWENAQKCADIVKLAGYNYGERLYELHHKIHPDYMIYGSETSSVVQSRGIYHFPLSQMVLADDDEQCSSIGNCATCWSAKNSEAAIIPDRDADYCAGQFIWTGFDYIGEPTPYNTKNSYFGQFDTAGFAKDSAYVYRSAWTDYKTAPFVHIFPYWDFSEGMPIDVRVATNAPKVALYFNGECVAEKIIDHIHGKELTLNVILPYEKGELVAIAYDEEGKEIARDRKASFGDTAGLHLTLNKYEGNTCISYPTDPMPTLIADGQDMVFLTIDAYDEKGEFVANANNRVQVSVSGAARLVGLDNGDSTDYDQYKGISRRLFSGKLLAMIAAKDEAGEVQIQVSSKGLPTETLTLMAEPVPSSEIIAHPVTENRDMAPEIGNSAEDIPVRKIEFITTTNRFTADCREMDIAIRVHPANATYKDQLEFRVTSVLGIETNLAEILWVKDNQIRIKCLGDGEFYLRGLCKNGTEKYHILAAYPFVGEGLGSAFFNPYEFVTGGLYNVANEKAGNGINRGAGFLGNGLGWFGYENVDFGDNGSDQVTLPIFANCTTPVSIQVYDGIPDQGGVLIGDFTYHKEPKWMVYQPETYKLNRVLTGVHTIVFASVDGYNLEGFIFTQRDRTRSFIPAASALHIYGDKYEVSGDEVLGIGNNVVLDFGTFDFTDNPPKSIAITGRSALPLNSIHVTFAGDTNHRVLAEFEGALGDTTRTYDISGITGICQLSFIFLPGTDFDLVGFRFQ